MKSKEEIDELYHKYWDDFSSKYDDNLHYYSFVEGYLQCQKDMARKEIQPEDIWNKESQDKIKEHILNRANNQSSEDIIKTELAAKKYAEEDMADKKYTEDDLREAIDMARMLSHVSCLEEGEHRLKYSNTEEDIINSLNKQD